MMDQAEKLDGLDTLLFQFVSPPLFDDEGSKGSDFAHYTGMKIR